MSLRKLPKLAPFQRPQSYVGEAPDRAFTQWADAPVASAVTDGNVIEINDVIGEDWWTGGGFTSNRMSAALRSIGPNPVDVMINSPGGDMFEGLAIYNMLAAHPAKVTVTVLSWAASAASIIAMGGDEIIMAQSAFLMIHNAWGGTIGNRHDFLNAYEVFGKFDQAMAEIYSGRTGMSVADVSAMMDGPTRASDGTWLTAQEAVDNKFADRTSEDAKAVAAVSAEPDKKIWARRQIESALIKEGMPRSERRKLLKEAYGMPGAAETVTQDADPTTEPDLMPGLAALIDTLRA